MSDLPNMPTDIVGDGSNIWDWAAKFSDAVHRRAKISDLSQRIAKRTCGDCYHWMTKGCPREVSGGLSGYSKGPSCDGHPCSAYTETTSCASLRAKWQAEKDALNA